MSKMMPLKMQPCYKEYLWGGRRLRRDFGKADAPEVAAESWELADHPNGCAVVAQGEYAGKTLTQLRELDQVGFWGTGCAAENFPLLVKLIDAEKDLSIQVHPSDATALTEQGEAGKLEMWYIVDCTPQAAIYYGFSQRVDEKTFLKKALDGTICEILNCVPVARGDVFYILPGTIHAIGAGIVIAEIQQNSDSTFRVYDYQRQGADGKLRPLHLERSAAVLDYTPLLPAECKVNNIAVFPEFTMAEMFSCPYFRAFRLDVRTVAQLRCDGRSFQHLLCVEGSGVLVCDHVRYPFRRGDSYFLPAMMGDYELEGNSRVLISRL